ncbi:MFS transporter [Demequina aurantiaca]|uniref:MFS transporter n=1 Tax=Demequina aurantiaca TaxID=676200 RepID=UPI000782810B|nr:MFS transporter [Demequina aurantiaca]
MAKPVTTSVTVLQAQAEAEGIAPDVFRRRWTILAVLCTTLLTVVLANSSLNLALPSLARDLGASQLDLTWIVEAFTLVFASLLMVAAGISDRYGRAKLMIIGLAIYAIAAAYAAAFAGSPAEVIGTRAVMGLGAALVMPNTLSTVNVVFPKSERTKAIAIWSAISSAGMILGSIASGFLLESFSWHSLFILSAVVAVASLVGVALIVPNSRDENRNPVDWWGGLFVTIALTGIVFGIMESPLKGLGSTEVLIALGIGAAGLLAFIVWELRAPFPLLDLRLFKNPSFAVSALAVTLAFFAMMAAFFGNSQIFQLVLGYEPLTAAYAFIPIMLPMLILTPFVPNIVARLGARWTVTPGLILVALGFAWMSQWPTDLTYAEVLGAMGLLIVGMSLTMTPATAMMMSSVPKNRSGMGSAMSNTTRQVGGALGVAILGSMISAGYQTRMSDVVAGTELPARAADAAQSSLAGGLQVADSLGDQGAALAEAAKDAYMLGNSTAMWVGAGIALAAAFIAVFGIPKRVPRAAAVEAGLADSIVVVDDPVDESAVVGAGLGGHQRLAGRE